MNKLSIGINLVLLAAVGFLYYYNFSGKKNNASVGNQIATVCSTQHHIAYVELDSLNENLVVFKQKRKALELQQKNAELEISNDYKDLEAKKNIFFQKNPNATPEQIQNLRAELDKDQQDIEQKKQIRSQGLNQKNFELMESIQKNLKSFLTEYNKEKKYQYILTTGSGIDYLIYKGQYT
ncbi:MAG: OmpH family outer membrane protein [Ferruginibacter sp.]